MQEDSLGISYPAKQNIPVVIPTSSRNMAATSYPKHTTSIPYAGESSSPLQTLDIWLPRPLEQSDADKSLWIVFIHGGAWRDPLQTAANANATIKHLSSNPPSNLAGIASLNYRLSPYPSHPTHPSDPSDPDRNVAHPAHIEDLAAAVSFLQREHGMKRWIGLGHSCGATMLCHYVSGMTGDIGLGPEGLILIAGIYNIPLLLRNHLPPAVPENVAVIYSTLISGAFGTDSSVYQGVSPVAGRYGKDVWKGGKLVVLAHSYEDELVERAQRDVMCVAFDREGWSIVMEDGDEEANIVTGRRVLEVRDIKGTHNFVWEDGEQSAKLILDALQRLT
ncbi:hypothetical protein HBH56_209230 [Parastagonospora nodorum]|uniref:Kynurenine formamidase n=1 Tax=Phaeosphaeria nodorum (strain SN15 / ATCC MYA-4574 / FGSC 10173) TaxID=321614 RepID=A0A7U2I1C5_PHANO|nr:hypothetical protein HBH56_209230 [Parastagonospora nodorum]QRC99675.1 hypothetical protein JI435_309200 [Parastagonospora nodorum SN15]KAH3923575.1 hypothetical protein HBH54_208100 [Parastagonospora nodorum]KAH3960381.1 hypothetical protein HBH51_192610 [Parastagonospora nodorum]KAH3992362.1 hypothetical protein HBI10_218130 [Parastagonospora nodorum]